MRPRLILVLLVVALAAASRADDLEVLGKQLHVDLFNAPENQVPWSEGWGEEDQFYPRYFQPAGALHLFLKNNGKRAITVDDLLFDGKRISDVCTRPDYAGPVIWYRTNPETIQPGKSAMVTVRLRHALTRPVSLGVRYDGEKTLQTTVDPTSDAPDVRLAFAAFDFAQNKVCLYVRMLSAGNHTVSSVSLDGVPVPSSSYRVINESFADGCPAYIEFTPVQPLEHGAFVTVTVQIFNGSAVSYQLRVREAQFIRGLIFGDPARYKMYQQNFFNTIYILGHAASEIRDDFWQGMNEHPSLSLIRTASREADVSKVLKAASKQRFIFNAIDEPDANDWWYTRLPLQDRCGVGIMNVVEPMLKRARAQAPEFLTTEILNSTFAPANFYIYGEVTDICSKDIYPMYTHGESSAMNDIPVSLQTVLNASAPRPVNVVLWGILATVDRFRRAYVPFENESEVLYAIGSGVKGVTFFMDTSGAVKTSGGEYYLGATSLKPLWQSMGKLNARITRLSPLLINSYPVPLASSSNPSQLWVSALQSGDEALVVTAVNKNYVVRANDRMKFPHVFPISNESVRINLPGWLRGDGLTCYEVSWDKLERIDCRPTESGVEIPIKDMISPKVFVISRASNSEQRLALDPNQLAEMRSSWPKPSPRTGTPIAQKPSGKPIVLSEQDVGRKELSLDFKQAADLQKASEIRLVSAELDETATGVALFPLDNKIESRMELTYLLRSPVPLKNLRASLAGTTPNFGYGANNAVGVASAIVAADESGPAFVYDKSYKVDWGGGTNGQKLEAALSKPSNQFLIKVTMSDPNIVWPGEYSNTISTLRITWDSDE